MVTIAAVNNIPRPAKMKRKRFLRPEWSAMAPRAGATSAVRIMPAVFV
jgi:hypothetical protein